MRFLILLIGLAALQNRLVFRETCLFILINDYSITLKYFFGKNKIVAGRGELFEVSDS